jgi:DNA-binding response OmpR family regulator
VSPPPAHFHTFRSYLALLPIIVLSGRTDEVDRIAAFRLGADDYLTKPFSLLELNQRIRLRSRADPERVCQSMLCIDVQRRTVEVGGNTLRLTALEFDLMVELIRSNGAVLSKTTLLQRVWRTHADIKTRTVDFYIGRLRRKLAAAGVTDALRTVRGRGVAWTADAPSRLKE